MTRHETPMVAEAGRQARHAVPAAKEPPTARPTASLAASLAASLTASLTAWLEAAAAAARHEARLLVHSPLTLIFQVWFLLALAIAIFLVADFFSSDVASVGLLATFLPWVSLIMAPALAMRAFAEGPGDRGLELMLSLPLPLSAVVTGKWLAGTAVLWLTLAMTAPFAATVGYLGEPDWGAVAATYLGGALLLAAFYAAAILAASLTRDHVTAYVLGLATLTLFIAIGWDSAARALSGTPFERIAAGLAPVSPKYWLDRMSEGRIELAAVVYFAAVIALVLFLAGMVLEARRRAGAGAGRSLWRAAAGLVIALAALSVAVRLPGAIDLTAEQEFTLHPETRKALADAPPGLSVDLYYSRDEARVPASIRQHAVRVENLLRAFSREAGGRIDVRVNRVVEDGEAEAEALAAGVRRVPMTSGDTFVLGAVYRHGERVGVTSYFDEARAGLAEYDLALAVRTLGETRARRVGILSPLIKSSDLQTKREGLAIVEELKRHSDVAVIPHFADALPEGLDALIIIDAPVLKRSMLYSIDQHLMAGRGLVAMVDPYPRFNRGNLQIEPNPSQEVNDLTDLLAAYGARLSPGKVVGDADLAAEVAGGDGRQLTYPFWLRVRGPALSRAHPSTASLNELLFAEAGGIDLRASPGAVALVRTGPKSGTVPRGDFSKGGSEAMAAQFAADGEGARVVAAALGGPFDSAFDADGDLPEGADPGGHRQRVEAASLFVVADADWLFDPMALQAIEVGGRTVSRPLNDNVTFLLNMAESASGDARLVGIRSRGQIRRPFTRVAKLLREANARYRAEEAEALARISGVEERIAKVLQATGARSVEDLPGELAAQIRDLREKLLPFRRELRRIRRSMREDVERLSTQVTIANLAGGPLLAMGFSGVVWWRRRRRGRRRSD